MTEKVLEALSGFCYVLHKLFCTVSAWHWRLFHQLCVQGCVISRMNLLACKVILKALLTLFTVFIIDRKPHSVTEILLFTRLLSVSASFNHQIVKATAWIVLNEHYHFNFSIALLRQAHLSDSNLYLFHSVENTMSLFLPELCCSRHSNWQWC